MNYKHDEMDYTEYLLLSHSVTESKYMNYFANN